MTNLCQISSHSQMLSLLEKEKKIFKRKAAQKSSLGIKHLKEIGHLYLYYLKTSWTLLTWA